MTAGMKKEVDFGRVHSFLLLMLMSHALQADVVSSLSLDSESLKLPLFPVIP
jgi:hypothetical protein